MNSSYIFLQSKITEAGFDGYEQFMITAAIEELSSRVKLLGKLGSSETHFPNETLTNNKELSKISEVANITSKSLNTVLDNVQGFQDSTKILSETIEALDNEFSNLKLISINMKITALKFGEIAASLAVVSNEFSVLSTKIERHLDGLSNFTSIVLRANQQSLLNISELNIQMLMVDFFVKESIERSQTSEHAFSELIENQANFSTLYSKSSNQLKCEMEAMNASVDSLLNQMEEVSKFITGLEVIRQMGAVESARTEEIKLTFGHYLTALDQFVQQLRAATVKINGCSFILKKNIKTIKVTADDISANVDAIFGLASAFGGDAGLESLKVQSN